MNQLARGDYLWRVTAGVAVGVLVLGLALLAWRAASILLYIFAGVLLAVFLRTLGNFFSRHFPLSPRWGLAVTVLLLLALLGGAGWLVGPRLAGQATQLADTLPDSLSQVERFLSQYSWGERLVEQLPATDEFSLSRFDVSPGSVVSRLTGTASTLWNGVAHVIFFLFVGLFIAVNPTLYRDGVVKLFAKPRHERVREVMSELWRTVQGWLLGQLVSMTLIGVLTWLGLWLLGVPFAFVLGLIAGLSEFVPFVGPILSAVPAVLLALTEGPTQALYVALLYVVIQQLEGNVIMPVVQKKAVDLPPVLSLTAVFVLGALFGFVGVLVATPLAAVAMVLVKMLYVEDVLNGAVELPGRP